MTAQPLRALVVGAGRMGALHERVAREAGLEVSTVDPNRRADFETIESAPPAEVVVIATPIPQLAESACSAMRRGCERILIEKPMAATAAQGRAVLECAEETGTRLSVGFTERFDPVVAAVGDELRWEIGTVESLSFERLSPRPAPPGAAAHLDLAVHDLDLMRHLGFPPDGGHGTSTRDSITAELDCGGVRATLHAAYDASRARRHFVITGSDGRIECDLLHGTVLVVAGGETVERSPTGREPLAAEWDAVLDGGGPSGGCGLAALELALELAA